MQNPVTKVFPKAYTIRPNLAGKIMMYDVMRIGMYLQDLSGTHTETKDYLLLYNYTGRPMQIDLTKIDGNKKAAWWYSPKDGQLKYIGEFDNKMESFQYGMSDNDQVLIVIDASKDYLKKLRNFSLTK